MNNILLDTTMDQINEEAHRAHHKYGQPASAHEALGVLLEEFDELKEAIHANDAQKIEREAIQVAAVAYRLALAVASKSHAFMSRSGLTS